MGRQWWLYTIDVLMGVAFILVFFTGVVKMPFLQSPINKQHPLSVIHDWAGIVMGLLVFVHLALHWQWVVIMTKKLFKKQS